MNVSPLGLAAAALPAGVPAQRVPVSSGQLLTACRLAWEQDGRLVALWASDERDRNRGFCVRVALEDRDGLTLLEHRCLTRMRTTRISRRSFPRRTACSARRSTSSASPPTPTTSARGRGWRRGRSTSIRCAAISSHRRNGSRDRRTTRSFASKATACTRSRSGRCTRASSSPAISASRSSARRCCGWRSGLASCTRASRSASSRCRSRTAIAWRAACPAIQHGGLCAGPTRTRWSRSRASQHRRAPRGCAHWRSSASASRITWAISATSATMADSRSGSRNSRVSGRTCCASIEPRSVIGC